MRIQIPIAGNHHLISSVREKVVEDRTIGKDLVVNLGDKIFQMRVAIDARREVVNVAVNLELDLERRRRDLDRELHRDGHGGGQQIWKREREGRIGNVGVY